jgi:hypothetical protein
MKLLLGMLVGVLAQTLTFLQLQGRWKFEWMKEPSMGYGITRYSYLNIVYDIS